MTQPGLRVEALPELGRTLVAARAFAPYEVVLSEQPLLSWSGTQGGASFLDAAAAAPAGVVAALLDFARPALDDASPRVGLQQDAAAMWLTARGGAVPDGWTAETAHALLLVADTNTHSFAGGGGDRLALFALASKAAHCCAPNCLYSSRHAAGVLRYVASRAIAEGEAITFSYLADEQASPRAVRRAQLLATKHFRCRCTRCAGRDDCRGLRCGACASGTLLCADGGEEAEPSAWACTSCSAPPPARAWLDAQLRAEAKLVARHELLHKSLRSGEALRRPPDELAAFCALVAGALAPTHWLFAAGAQLRITWAASQRAALVKSLGAGRPGTPPPIAPAPWGGGALVSAAIFSAAAAAAGMELLRCCECIAAGCVGGASCPAKTQPHPPAAGATHVALWAVQDLRASGAPADAETARVVAPRYLPLMRAQFGEDDDDVRSIGAWLGSSSS